MNIVLIGLRGAGKTTVAKLLSKKQSMNCISTDDEISAIEKASISNIVKNHGWKHFRRLEKNVITGLADSDNTVIDTGGGVIMDPDNVKILKSLGKVFCLTAPVSLLYKRIERSIDRPKLTNEDDGLSELNKLFEERESLYREAADAIVDTEGKSPKQIVEEIVT